MALWSQFKSIYEKQGSTNYASSIYSLTQSEDVLVLYLRVVFSEWIEKSIGVVSPRNFMRGLQFVVQKALQKNPKRSTDSDAIRAKISKFFVQLSKLKTLSEIERFHKKLVHCLTGEFKLLLLQPQNMEGLIDEHLHRMMQAQERQISVPENISEIEKCKKSVYDQYVELERVKKEFQLSIGNLAKFFENFNTWNNQYVHQGPRYIQVGQNEQIDVVEQLINGARNIMSGKSSLIEKIGEINGKTASITSLFKDYVQYFERLHLFTNRSCQLEGDSLESMGNLAENVIQLLQEVLCLLTYQCNFDFSNLFESIYTAVLANGLIEPDLIDRSNYLFDVSTYNANLNGFIWSVYQTFTLVIDRHPPMVVMKGSSPRTVSFRIFNLNNVFTNRGFRISMRLINENMVQSVRGSNIIPNESLSSGTISVCDPEPSGASSNTTGKKKRKPMDNEKTGNVVTFEGHFQPNQKCLLVEKQVKIVERPTDKSDSKKPDVTSKKFAFLLVAEILFGNETRQVWATSLPMTLTAHASQNDKAWLTIAWDEALAVPKRNGFETFETANWSQISELLQRTFEVIVGGSLSTAHVEYLRRKAEDCLRPNFPANISMKDLMGTERKKNEKNSNKEFWPWFFKTTMVVKKDSHFHDAWMNNYIEGFIGYEDARSLLSRSDVKPGTFIFRFSDAEPGCLTLVFLAYNKEIYKMQAMEASKQNTALDECADTLLEKLDLKETRGYEVFLRVYPDICKKIAFEKFYKARKTPKTGSTKPYLTVEMLVPVPANGSGKTSSSNGASNGSSGDKSEKTVSSPEEVPPNKQPQLDANAAAVVGDIADRVENETIAVHEPFEIMDIDEWGIDTAAILDEVFNCDFSTIFAQ